MFPSRERELRPPISFLPSLPTVTMAVAMVRIPSLVSLAPSNSNFHHLPPVKKPPPPLVSLSGVHRRCDGGCYRRSSSSIVKCVMEGGSCKDEAYGNDHSFYMKRCVELARKAVGFTSPNPMVGCVLVKNGVVVGEGFHPKAGQPHAEVFALRAAGDMAESATAYVSLEPCNHHGRTPPCTEALIRAKVEQVVVGMVDPNPLVASKGVQRLKDHGIKVTVGVEEMLCKQLNEAYIHKMVTGKPFVSVRCSRSIKGEIVSELGKDADKPGGYYSSLLQEHDGVVISSDSLSSNDDAKFPTSQEIGANQPVQLIVPGSTSSTFKLPSFPAEAGSRTVVFLNKDTKVDQQTEGILRKQGIEVLRPDKITLNALLDYCSNRGMCSVLFDLRSSNDCDWLIKEGLEEKLLQKVVIEEAWSNFAGGKDAFLELGSNHLHWKEMHSRIVKESTLTEGYVS